jgi:hypothetical protein
MERFTLGRAIGIMLLITFLAGSYVYHLEVGHALIWLGHQVAGDESSENKQTLQPVVAPAAPAGTEPAPAENATKPVESAPPAAAAIENKSAEPVPTTEHPTAPPLQDASAASSVPQAAENHPRIPLTPSPGSTDSGEKEYRQAAEILHAPNRKAELPEAIRLLWAAVEKGNVGAEITLAELYHHGRGVAKSCDQTRILLSAAARKGSPDAQARLQEFRNEGCRD